jgi:hypothetical protein
VIIADSIRLEDTHGPAGSRRDIDALVVSPEGKAQHRAHELNQQRVSDGLPPLEIHTAPFVTGDSSTNPADVQICRSILYSESPAIFSNPTFSYRLKAVSLYRSTLSHTFSTPSFWPHPSRHPIRFEPMCACW